MKGKLTAYWVFGARSDPPVGYDAPRGLRHDSGAVAVMRLVVGGLARVRETGVERVE